MFTNPDSLLTSFSVPTAPKPSNRMKGVLEKKQALYSKQARKAFAFAPLFPRMRRFPLLLTPTQEYPGAVAAPKASTHQLTVYSPVSNDRSKDRIFLNDVEIDPSNLRWEADRQTLTFRQPTWDGIASGHVTFSPGFWSMHGTLSLGGVEHAVRSSRLEAHFVCTLSANAGAYQDSSGQLKWNESQWKNATWTSEALHFCYYVAEDASGERYIGVSFEDLQTHARWEPPTGRNPDDPFSTAGFIMSLSGSNRILYEHTAVNPPIPDDRTHLAGNIATVFPRRMDLQLDALAQTLKGAISVTTEDGQQLVYTIQGHNTEPRLMGRYQLSSRDGQRLGDLSLSGNRVLLNDQPMPGARLRGNSLVWGSLDLDQAARHGLPQSGMLEFSPDGEQILNGPEGILGHRLRAGPRLLALAGEEKPALQVTELLNLDPYEPTKDGVADVVQLQVNDSLEEIIKFYTPDKWRERFISPGPVKLDAQVQRIAETRIEGEEPRALYESLAIPYLTAGLYLPGNPTARRFNRQRALARMKKRASDSKLYQQHMVMLYNHHWRKKFPSVEEFFQDNQKNLEQKQREMGEHVAKLKVYVEQRIKNSPDDTTREQLNEWLRAQSEATEHAIRTRTYWAWRFFSTVTSTNLLASMEMQIFNGESSVVRKIQRFHSVLRLLDESGYFADRYGEIMRIFQLVSLIAGRVDLSSNQEFFKKILNQILTEFVKKHESTKDPSMKEIADQLGEYVKGQQGSRTNAIWAVATKLFGMINEGSVFKRGVENAVTLIGIMREQARVSNLLMGFLTDVLAQDWEHNPTWREKITNVFGGLKSYASTIVFTVLGAFSVAGTVVSLSINWKELPPLKRDLMITLGVFQFSHFIALGLKTGLDLIATHRIMQTHGGFWHHMTRRGGVDASQIEGYYRNGLAQWIVRSGYASEGAEVMARALSARCPRGLQGAGKVVGRFLGRGLTRVSTVILSAVTAVVGLIMSAYDLAHSKEPLEKWSNAMFLVSAILECCAVVLEVVSMAAVGVLSVVCSVLSCVVAAFAIILAVVGLILMIVLLVRSAKSPVDEFAEEAAAPQGLLKEKDVEIDDFALGNAKAGKAVVKGVSIRDSRNGALYLRLGSDAASAGALTHDTETVFDFDTDDQGRAELSSLRFPRPAEVEQVVLALSKDGKLVVKPISELTDELLPKGEVVEAPRVSEKEEESDMTKEGLAKRASVRFFFEVGGKRRYLGLSGQGPVLSDTPVGLFIERMGAKPQELIMDPIQLQGIDRDRQFFPYLGARGNDREGLTELTFELEGNLPPFLEFVKESGSVRQKQGVVPSAPFHQEGLKLLARNAYGSVSALFSIDVVLA